VCTATTFKQRGREKISTIREYFFSIFFFYPVVDRGRDTSAGVCTDTLASVLDYLYRVYPLGYRRDTMGVRPFSALNYINCVFFLFAPFTFSSRRGNYYSQRSLFTIVVHEAGFDLASYVCVYARKGMLNRDLGNLFKLG